MDNEIWNSYDASNQALQPEPSLQQDESSTAASHTSDGQGPTTNKPVRKRTTINDVVARIKVLSAIPLKDRSKQEKAELKGLKGIKRELEGKQIAKESRKEYRQATIESMVKFLSYKNIHNEKGLKKLCKFAEEHGYTY